MGFGFETLIDKSFIIAISIPIFLRFVKIFKRRQALMCLSSVSPQVILAYLVFLSALTFCRRSLSAVGLEEGCNEGSEACADEDGDEVAVPKGAQREDERH